METNYVFFLNKSVVCHKWSSNDKESVFFHEKTKEYWTLTQWRKNQSHNGPTQQSAGRQYDQPQIPLGGPVQEFASAMNLFFVRRAATPVLPPAY